MSVCRRVGASACRCAGVLVCWYVGSPRPHLDDRAIRKLHPSRFARLLIHHNLVNLGPEPQLALAGLLIKVIERH